MSESADAILDAAECRMRVGGFNGFSFRDIAEDVGIKSSSVHYHFPTKEKLAAAVVHRYSDTVLTIIDDFAKTEKDPEALWTKTFRTTIYSKNRMCPVTVLAAAALDLPPEVAAEVKRFYKIVLAKMESAGLSHEQATALLAQITGALVIANALREKSAYDDATSNIGSGAAATKRAPRRKSASA